MAPAQLKLASIDARPKAGEFTFQWHCHPFIEWGMVLEGECRWSVGAENYDLTEGEVIMVPQGAVHREQIGKGQRARLSWLGFTSGSSTYSAGLAPGVQGFGGTVSVLNGLPAEAGADRSYIQFVDSAAPPPSPLPDNGGLKPFKLPRGRWDTDIRRLFLTLYDEQSEPAWGSETRIRLCLGELLLLALRTIAAAEAGADAVAAPASSVPLRQMQLAHAASRFFDNNTEQGVTIESVARYFQLTPQYFSTLFRRVHGVSPAHYQQGARVRQACRLLSGSQLSVKEIASLCGYADSAHFCRQFKTHEQCSPSQYRLRKAAATCTLHR